MRTLFSILFSLAFAASASAADTPPSVSSVPSTSVPSATFPTMRVAVSGTVRMSDGSPVPDGLTVACFTCGKHDATAGAVAAVADHGYAGVVASAHARVDGGRFSCTLTRGEVLLQVSGGKNRAPTFAGPFLVPADGKLADVDLVIGPGFTAQLRVVDADGRPIRAASLKGTYLWPATPILNLTTDADGLAHVEHAADRPVEFATLAPGYQYNSSHVLLKADETQTITLSRATPTTGTVVAAATGRPVPGAALYMSYSTDEKDRRCLNYDYSLIHPILTADGDGRFTFDTLRSDLKYDFIVEAPGCQPTFVRNIAAGEGFTVRLPPALTVSGRVVGPPDLLRTNDMTGHEGLFVVFQMPYPCGPNTTRFSRVFVPVDRDGRFSTSRLWLCTLTVRAGPLERELEVTQSISDLVLDLNKAAAVRQRDDDAIRLAATAPVAPPDPGRTLPADAVPPPFDDEAFSLVAKKCNLPAAAWSNKLLLATLAQVVHDNQLRLESNGVPLLIDLEAMKRLPDSAAIEARAAELVRKYPVPADHAQIYADLADYFGSRGCPPITGVWARQALDGPLTPPRRLQMYLRIGDAIIIAHGNNRNAGAEAAFCEIELPFLEGLREALLYTLPDAVDPNLPSEVGCHTIYENPTEAELALCRQQWQAHFIAKFLYDLVMMRDCLVSQSLSQIYPPGSPPNQAELARFRAALNDPATVDRLIATARQGHGLREALESFVASPGPPPGK